MKEKHGTATGSLTQDGVRSPRDCSRFLHAALSGSLRIGLSIFKGTTRESDAPLDYHKRSRHSHHDGDREGMLAGI